MHLAICKNTLFTKVFEKFFNEILFWRTVCTITVLSQTFWLSRKTNGLERRSANRQFPPNVKFLHRNSVSLDKLPTFRKKWFAKNIKKIPSGPFGPLGIFFWPLIPNLFCVRYFALIKNSRRITERQPYFVLTWRAVKKNIVPNKKTTKKTTFFAFFGSSGRNWISILFVSFKCFVTLAFHAFGDL